MNDQMQTSVPDVYAAGDICHAGWEPSPLWIQVQYGYCIYMFVCGGGGEATLDTGLLHVLCMYVGRGGGWLLGISVMPPGIPLLWIQIRGVGYLTCSSVQEMKKLTY